ncbi:ABC transporter ATP-binding protein [Streptococcus anginosus]|nr:ABC transporter ATP-binding protein [Streptococcus anginosus]
MKLTLEHIYFRDVFKDLTFAFETGKMTLLIGDTGAGKSTLFRILTNFNELDFSGEVKLGDTLLSHLPIHKRVTYLSMMFQNPSRQFTMPTLYEELIFTLENLQTPSDQIDEKIQHAIALGKVEHLLHRDFLTLSGGEKQQVSLAVLLAMDSQIILLDGPLLLSIKKHASA